MKRRLVSFLLCVALLFTGIMATGCADLEEDEDPTETGEEENDGLTRSGMTLTLWVPTQEGTTEESLELVEEAINKITQAEFDTAIKLYGIPTADYEDAVKKQVEDINTRVEEAEKKAQERRKAEREAAKRGETLPPEEEDDDDTIKNPYDLIVDSGAGYPHVEENQMDIFLIRGYDNYRYYTDNFYVQSLNEEINGTSKILKSYIYPSFFEAAEVDGTIYGVPNNHALGEYTYLLVNKDLATKYGYTQKDLMTAVNCSQFVEDVAANEAGVTPVWGNITPSYMQYWSGRGAKSFSVLASRVTASQNIDEVKVENVFNITDFVDNTYLQKLFTEKGYISTADSVDNFGIALVKATPAEIEAKYADSCYVNIHQSPEGTLEDYCSAVFAVSTFTESTARSMEIITLLNTSEEIRTVLQYGVEGQHWKQDELDNSVIVQLSDEYNMNIMDTGNVYMTYPDYGAAMDWSSEKTQNLDSFYPVTYYMTDFVHESNSELVANFDKFCIEIENQIAAMDAETFKSSVSSLRSMVEDNEYYQKIAYMPSSSDVQKGRTEENGWLPDNSIAYQWAERVKFILENG
ncbi:MAG: hypothetical protein IKL36_02235 [Clostridia bacterium]|nr:hypothetical protein [Clostridia bacterium]